jgi:hypothetical protein
MSRIPKFIARTFLDGSKIDEVKNRDKLMYRKNLCLGETPKRCVSRRKVLLQDRTCWRMYEGYDQMSSKAGGERNGECGSCMIAMTYKRPGVLVAV